MNRSPIIQKGTKSKPHVHNANWPIDIRLLQDHLIPKSLSFFPTYNTCYSSQSETEGEKGVS